MEMYARVRRACMVEGTSVREAAREFIFSRHAGLLCIVCLSSPSSSLNSRSRQPMWASIRGRTSRNTPPRRQHRRSRGPAQAAAERGAEPEATRSAWAAPRAKPWPARDDRHRYTGEGHYDTRFGVLPPGWPCMAALFVLQPNGVSMCAGLFLRQSLGPSSVTDNLPGRTIPV